MQQVKLSLSEHSMERTVDVQQVCGYSSRPCVCVKLDNVCPCTLWQLIGVECFQLPGVAHINKTHLTAAAAAAAEAAAAAKHIGCE